MSLLRENIPLAVVTTVLVIAIIVLYREVASIKSTITQCPPPVEYNIASIVPPSPRGLEEVSETQPGIPTSVDDVPVLKPALKKRTVTPKLNTIGEEA